VPTLVRRLNKALQRADQIQHADGQEGPYWFAPIVADAEAGFGGNLNAFELMKGMIEAGAAGVHFEDQLSSAKRPRSAGTWEARSWCQSPSSSRS
jgi:isocitrate lyase